MRAFWRSSLTPCATNSRSNCVRWMSGGQAADADRPRADDPSIQRDVTLEAIARLVVECEAEQQRTAGKGARGGTEQWGATPARRVCRPACQSPQLRLSQNGAVPLLLLGCDTQCPVDRYCDGGAQCSARVQAPTG